MSGAPDKPLLWLRDEPKAGERRTLLPPDAAAALVEAGYPLVVEASANRAFALDRYAGLGARIEPSGAWRDAPTDAIVLGLKELDPARGPFVHRHVHFQHAYKYQRGWAEALGAFDAGGGSLHDLEYLVDGAGRRVAAFGRHAGFVGGALALLVLAGRLGPGSTSDPVSGPALDAWPDADALVTDVRDALAARGGEAPRVLVIGANGRSGRGAVEACEACGARVTRWDVAETSAGGPFAEVLDHDALVSCAFVDAPVPPFTTLEALRGAPARRLRAIVDVGCDPYSAANPLPVYGAPTTLERPVVRIVEGTGDASGGTSGGTSGGAPAVDLVAIDHLPSLLPREASADFAAQLLPHLLRIDRLDEGAWARARSMFDARLIEARAARGGQGGATA